MSDSKGVRLRGRQVTAEHRPTREKTDKERSYLLSSNYLKMWEVRCFCHVIVDRGDYSYMFSTNFRHEVEDDPVQGFLSDLR